MLLQENESIAATPWSGCKSLRRLPSGRGEAQGCAERAGFTWTLPPPVPDKPEGISRGHREAAIYRREPG
ncbi:hypothetical protein, partial [Enterobacter asburiae]|uniref:hypothetical protein n=1 Tax=Enterobacter asburiae TaxID=61645 RepID=UPI001E3F941E